MVCACPALAGGLVALSLRRRTHQPVKGCGWAGHTQVMPHEWRWGGGVVVSPPKAARLRALVLAGAGLT